MDGSLYFCNDGVLRFSHNQDEPAIPLVNIQRLLNEDPYYILNFLRHTTYIEKNTSVKNFMIALEPWANVLSKIIGRNMTAWIDRVKENIPCNPTEIEWVGIYKTVDLSRTYEYEDTPDPDSAWGLGKNHAVDCFDIESFYSASGFLKDSHDRYSLSTGVDDIKDLPIVQLEYSPIVITPGREEKLRITTTGPGLGHTDYFSYIKAKAMSSTLLDLIEGFFVEGLFFDSPSSSESMMESLAESKASLEEFITEKNKPKPRLVEDETSEDKPKELEVHFVEGFADGIIAHEKQAKSEWEVIKHACFKKFTTPETKVGMQIAQPTEERLGGITLTSKRLS